MSARNKPVIDPQSSIFAPTFTRNGVSHSTLNPNLLFRKTIWFLHTSAPFLKQIQYHRATTAVKYTSEKTKPASPSHSIALEI